MNKYLFQLGTKRACLPLLDRGLERLDRAALELWREPRMTKPQLGTPGHRNIGEISKTPRQEQRVDLISDLLLREGKIRKPDS